MSPSTDQHPEWNRYFMSNDLSSTIEKIQLIEQLSTAMAKNDPLATYPLLIVSVLNDTLLEWSLMMTMC